MEQVLLLDSVSLREFTPADRDRLAKLANNEKISINLRDGFPHPYTLADAERFIEISRSFSPPQIFAIEYEGHYVGNIGLHRCDDVYRKSAEIGYFLGEPYWNMGIMPKAVTLICDYGFQNLDIVRIHTGVFEFNTASQRVLEKCGFTKEGVFKQAIFKQGKLWDEIRYAKLKPSDLD
ncbi:MAG: GNAT family protein [Tenuifilaceae bacterium]|jgi:RimJ/RimL family protein N-acetyltransferase|nr:GNAT family protein [Tenuifilaceae bacterium]